MQLQVYIGASLSKPHIDHDKGPVHVITKSEYLCISYPTVVACWFLRSVYALKCSAYSSILMCSHAWLSRQYNWTARPGALLIVWLSMKTEKRWCTDAYNKRIETTKTVWSCSGPETCHSACVKQPMLGWLYSFISTWEWHWTTVPVC